MTHVKIWEQNEYKVSIFVTIIKIETISKTKYVSKHPFTFFFQVHY